MGYRRMSLDPVWPIGASMPAQFGGARRPRRRRSSGSGKGSGSGRLGGANDDRVLSLCRPSPRPTVSSESERESSFDHFLHETSSQDFSFTPTSIGIRPRLRSTKSARATTDVTLGPPSAFPSPLVAPVLGDNRHGFPWSLTLFNLEPLPCLFERSLQPLALASRLEPPSAPRI